MSTSPNPTYARTASLTQWQKFFNQTNGIFRYPSIAGETIEHLDIDLRYLDHEDEKSIKEVEVGAVHLPLITVLTFRGGEYVQDHEERMDQIAEVLAAINPVEVRWLNASNDPSEQLTFATHLVHPAIIVAGEIYGQSGLRKLVLEGGFPVPNLTAPTPYNQTPAVTPLPSPRPSQISFLDLPHASKDYFHDEHHHVSRPTTPTLPKSALTFSGLPALSNIKPKPVDPEKVKARAERKRLADYSLKPRFDFAFGAWGAEEWCWKLEGKYTPACITSIITHWLKAIASTYPSPTNRTNILPLPALVTFSPIPVSILRALQHLPEELDIDEECEDWLKDVVLVSTGGNDFARLFDDIDAERGGKGEGEEMTKEREERRMKAEMLLLQRGSSSQYYTKSSTLDNLKTTPMTINKGLPVFDSPALSIESMIRGEGSSDDDLGAITPDLHDSGYLHSSVPVGQPSGDQMEVESKKEQETEIGGLISSLTI